MGIRPHSLLYVQLRLHNLQTSGTDEIEPTMVRKNHFINIQKYKKPTIKIQET